MTGFCDIGGEYFPLVMITRSRGRAEQEESKTIAKHKRLGRKCKLLARESSSSSYQLRSSMGKKGGITNHGASSRSKHVELSDITPVQLFPLNESEDTSYSEDIEVGYIMFMSVISNNCLSRFKSARCIIHEDFQTALNY